MDKHLAGVGPGGLSDKPMCQDVGEVVGDLTSCTCKRCLWTLYMVVQQQLSAVGVRLREVEGVTLRSGRRG